MNLGKTEIFLIIVGVIILLLLIGGKKIPDLARGISKTNKEFRDGLHGDKENKKDNDDKTK